MKIGYARVSSISQNLDRQIEILKENGCEKIFTEKVSGKTIKDRPVFNEALNYSREKDIFIVESLDRLGRNYIEVIETINTLKKKDVQLIITSLPIMQEIIGNELMDRFVKDLIIQILAMISEQERAESKRRQAQGIALAKQRGAFKGKPLIYSPNARDPQKRTIYFKIVEELKEGIPISTIAKRNAVTRTTVYRIKNSLN
ncbi:recombinase family protein (plasmid) [Macrococcoides bohemicum]|uniref:recombinase family protein n=1 Tax=Macrococcoides bohemicum TaxID=1903056 RepID=UPI001C5F1B9D|nr:recombinase family protein [Macrococcus bohemicus]QYA46048.1 recombinase family protein [Macrococcus bohemicus]